MTNLTNEQLCMNISFVPLTTIFNQACTDGDLSLVQHILGMKYFGTGKYQLVEGNGFHITKTLKKLDIYEYLLLQLESLDRVSIKKLVTRACMSGDIAFLKHVTTNENIDGYDTVYLYPDNLYNAVEANKIDVVEYLTSSPHLKEYININEGGDFAFRQACKKGHINIIKYFLESEKLKNHADIHVDQDSAFLYACRTKNVQLYTYMILDYEIDRTIEIQEYLYKNEEIKKLFEVRDFKNKIENKVVNINNKLNIKRMKI